MVEITDKQINESADFWADFIVGTPDVVDKFRKTLRRVIARRRNKIIFIEMDIVPEATLSEALKLAGLPANAIPEQRTQVLFKDDGSLEIWRDGKCLR